MPKYAIIKNATFARAVAKLNDIFNQRGEIQNTIALNTGIKQSEISKVLNGVRKKPNEAFQKLCQYAEIEFPEKISNPIADPRIQQALARSCDGSEESIVLIARLIECANVVMPSSRKNRV
jgi:transcriptional regulator with XRE-family HTH domain